MTKLVGSASLILSKVAALFSLKVLWLSFAMAVDRKTIRYGLDANQAIAVVGAEWYALRRVVNIKKNPFPYVRLYRLKEV